MTLVEVVFLVVFISYLSEDLSIGSCGPYLRSFRIRARSSASAWGDFPLSSLGSGLVSFWVLLWLVCRGFLRAGVPASWKNPGWISGSPTRDLAVSVSSWEPVLASSFGLRPLEVLLWPPHILCHFRHCFANLCVGRGSASCDSPAAYPLRWLAGQEAFSAFSWGRRSSGCGGLRCPVRKGRSALAWGRLAWSLTLYFFRKHRVVSHCMYLVCTLRSLTYAPRPSSPRLGRARLLI